MIFGPTHSCCWSKKSRQKEDDWMLLWRKIPTLLGVNKTVLFTYMVLGFVKKQNTRLWQTPFFFRNLELTSKIVWRNKCYRKHSILFYFTLTSLCFLPWLLLQVAVLGKPENCASCICHVRKRFSWGITVACICAFEKFCNFPLTLPLSLLFRQLSIVAEKKNWQKSYIHTFQGVP